MPTLIGSLFLVIALALIAAAILAFIRIGFGRLESEEGIAGDGLPVGSRVPPQLFQDLAGLMHHSPNGVRSQLLVFADHSLESFPDAVQALNSLTDDDAATSPEIIILTRSNSGLTRRKSTELNLNAPVVPVDPKLYFHYNVRVLPFGVLLNDRGDVQWNGVVGNEPQLRREFRLIQEQQIGESTQRLVVA